MNNNNNNNGLNNSKSNLKKTLTNLQWDQDNNNINNNNGNGFRSLTNLRFEDNNELLNDGFKSGPVSVQNYGSHFISNNLVNSFPMMQTSLLQGIDTNMITNNPMSNINNKELSMMNNNNNLSGTSNLLDTFGPKINGPKINGPKIIGPEPDFYRNIIDQDCIDTHCHLSKVVVKVIRQALEKLFDTFLFTNEVQIDYQQNRKNVFEFSGRVFSSSLSNFIVKIYKLKQKDKNGNISVVEIRKVYGDDFGYYKFEELLLKKLADQNILPKQQENKSVFGLPMDMDFGSLTLDDEDEDMQDVCDFSDNDNVSSIEENDEQFDFNLIESILETLYSKDSYREEYMHDAYQFSSMLLKNDKRSKNMINYILKNESQKLIEGILEPIKSNNLFCAFIIVHVLESIKILLSQKDIKSKLDIPKSFQNDIFNLRAKWSQNGVQNKIGPISVQFTRSQQIEKRCESLLQLID